MGDGDAAAQSFARDLYGASQNPRSRNDFLRAVVAEHGQKLTRFFASHTSDPSEAQDLVQEVYLRLLKLERPDLIRSPKAYLFRIAANIAREHWLKRASRPTHVALEDLSSDDLPADPSTVAGASPETAAATAEGLGQLDRLLAQLSPKVRAALIWAHRDGHTYQEISERLSVPQHRVKKYLAKALAHCRRDLAWVTASVA